MSTFLHIAVVGGLDPTGGAGILRDALTAKQNDADCTVIGTAWTRQSGQGVRGIEPRNPLALEAALRESLSSAAAVKIGMVPNEGAARAILRALDGFPGHVVHDPVWLASSGGALFDGEKEAMASLASRARLVTPNLAEAGWLLGTAVANARDAAAAAQALSTELGTAVLVKGGHLDGEAVDVLVDGEGTTHFAQPRIPGPSPRGTGCALATAIAARLARGIPLRVAIDGAKVWLSDRIAAARPVGDAWHLG